MLVKRSKIAGYECRGGASTTMSEGSVVDRCNHGRAGKQRARCQGEAGRVEGDGSRFKTMTQI